MFILSNSILGFFFFFLIFYFLCLYLSSSYLIINLHKEFVRNRSSTVVTFKNYLVSLNFKLQLFNYILILILIRNFHYTDIILFHGQLYLTKLSINVLYFLILIFNVISYAYKQVRSNYSSMFDYEIAAQFLFYFSWLIWSVTTIFSIIFILDILNILIYLAITVQTNILLKKKNTNTNNYYTFIHGFSTFFWVSFCASIFFFIFLIFFYIIYFTFDFYFLNFIFILLFQEITLYTYIKHAFLISIFLFLFFLKSGILPFFIWKPNFFKILNKSFMCFYIFFYYTNILLYFIYIYIIYLHFLINFIKLYIYILLIFIIALFIKISFNLTNFYAIFAFSSLLNTVLILFLIVGCTTEFGIIYRFII